MLLTEQIPAQWRMGNGGKDRAGKRQGRFSFNTQQMTMATDGLMWSLADLMTLLLIFFILLYSDAVQRSLLQTAESPLPVIQEQTTASDPAVTVSRKNDPAVTVQEAGKDAPLLSDAAEQTADKNVNHQVISALADRFSEDFYVRWEDRQPVIVLGERITFDIGQAKLLTDAQGTLKRVADLISQFGNCQVVVTGHTDDLPIHTNAFPSNWELSAARAASVAKALTDSGVVAGHLVIQGQAQFKPLVANSNDVNRRTNRRVEISLLTD